MKKLAFYSLLLIFMANTVFAQSPYSISPNWVFGKLGKMTFPTGDYPIAGAPVQGNTTLNVSDEASTAVSFKNNTVAFYTNARTAMNGANTTIRDFEADNTCASSATAGGVSFPDPARNDYPLGNITNDGFYLILGNDQTGGQCVNKGLNQYRFAGTGTGVVYNTGATSIETSAFPDEALTVATDGVNGYWVITHGKNVQNIFRVYHYTTAGLAGSADYQAGADYNSSSGGSQCYLKVSPCQNRIAFIGGNTLTVHNFNRATGAITGELLRVPSTGSGPGLEFSPSGNRIFYSGLGSGVSWADIGAPNNTGTVASTSSWTMQLGPDGKLYTSGPGYDASTIGVIANPDAATPTGTSIALVGGAVQHNGFVNQAWLSPESAFVNTPTGSGCDRTVSFDFENYFNTDIPVNAGTIIWNFDDGTGDLSGLGLTPTHTFPSTGTSVGYTITVTFNDAYCGHTWTANRIENVNCPLPVQLLNFSGASRSQGVLLSWQTATELNNEYFDLQRSTDGANFESIYKRAGAGNSNGMLSYQYIDPFEGSGIVYYRLVQHDFDGKTSVSRVIAIQLSNMPKVPVSIAPNPFSSSVVLTKLTDEEASVIIYDILGRVIETKSSPAGESVIYLGSNLVKGTYLVSYTSAESTYTQRVEKQ